LGDQATGVTGTVGMVGTPATTGSMGTAETPCRARAASALVTLYAVGIAVGSMDTPCCHVHCRRDGHLWRNVHRGARAANTTSPGYYLGSYYDNSDLL